MVKNQKYSIVYSSPIRIPNTYLAFWFNPIFNEADKRFLEYLLPIWLRIKNMIFITNTVNNQKYSIVYSSPIRIPNTYVAFWFNPIFNEADAFKRFLEYLLPIWLIIKNIL